MKLFPKRFLAATLALTAATLALPAQTAMNLGNLPLWFEAGHSQNGDTQFVAHGHDSEFSVSPSGAEIVLRQSGGKTAAVQMKFVGTTDVPDIAGDAELSGKINYFIGNDPAHWQSSVSTFGKVRLENIYAGVNVVYYGNQRQLEYDFDLAAGVNPATIAIRFDGAEKVSVNAQGELVVELAGGQVFQHEPVAYQTVSGARHEIQAGYKILDTHTVAFAIGNYDHSQPLVIDPILSFSTFFGGNYGETGWAIALDASNNIYVAGQTFSTQVSNNIPFATAGALQTTNLGGSLTGDAFVAKFDNLGTNLLYCTYLGGNAPDVAYALAVDGAGHAFVGGLTESSNFPIKNPIVYGIYNGTTISGVKDPQLGYQADAFVSELETNGASLVYSTYLGGEAADVVYGLALDSTSDAIVTGLTISTNFPTTAAAAYPRLRCTNNIYYNANAFVSEIAAGGKKLNYSTYLGGSNYDVGTAIAYKNGFVQVAGYTLSTNFPWTNGLIACKYLNSSNYLNNSATADAFVTGFATAGTNLTLLYSTYLGSSNADMATGVAADSNGNAYVVGWTTSTNFPVNTNIGLQLSSFVRTNTLGFVVATNAFLTQVLWNGTNAALGYSQMFGGYGVDRANAVTLDSAGNVFIVGSASSISNYPTTGGNLVGSLRTTNSQNYFYSHGSSDVVITAFKYDFSALLYSAYLGGGGNEFGYAIAVDAADNAYITGLAIKPAYTQLTNFPTFNARQTVLDGSNDVFLAKIMMASVPPLSAHTAGGNLLVTLPPMGQAIPPFIGLETSTNLVATNWVVITNQTPVLTNGNYTFKFSPTNRAQFFRIHQY